MEYFTELGLLGLFLSAFLAATILPLSSELVLTALLLADLNPVILVLIATAGNVLGSLANYAMGYWGSDFFLQKILKVSDQTLGTAKSRYTKYGKWSLLFAWVPIIGDPLTVVAGLLKVNIVWFLLLVTIGKFARYCLVAYVTLL